MPEKQTGRGIRVLIADDHRTFAEALKTVIDLERGIVVTEIVTDGKTAVDRAAAEHPDVVLMDVEMPEMDGIEAIREIKRRDPEARILVLSAHEDDITVARAVEAGASGFLSKLRAVTDVSDAVRAAVRGEELLQPDEVERILGQLRTTREEEEAARSRVERLTPRQVEILQAMADGLAPAEISEQLGISRHTLRTHVQNILTKLAVHSKLQALAVAIRHGKVDATRPANRRDDRD
ncbi:MAG TPA: response regulator transcription factor [Actinomycetota bacterium]|nr:response regulator transcription factor [Actinomycetota bacterium]